MHEKSDHVWEELGRASVDGIVVVGADGRVHFANAVAASLWKRDVAGRAIDELLAPKLSMICGRPSYARVDGVVRLEGGAEVPVHVWWREANAGVLLVLRDASEWEVAKTTLSLVAAGVEHAVDSFEITDGDGRIEYANAAHSVLTGTPLFEALGERLTRFVEDDASKLALDRSVAAATAWRGEVQCRRKDGALRWQELTLSPVIDGRGRVQRFVCVRRDITDRVSLEREAEALRAELALAEQNAIVGRLASSVAHEVNNPATSILANLEVAQDEVDQIAREIEIARVSSSPAALAALEDWWKKIRVDERLSSLRDTVADSREGTERVVNLVRDLRGLVRTQGPQAEIVDVNAVVRAVTQLERASFNGRASLAVELGAAPRVKIDRRSFAQVVVAILMNAAHSIEPGEEAKNRVMVRTARNGDHALIVVEDTGPGVAPEDVARMFDPFYAKRRALDVTSLGFAVARDVVEAAGGEMRVESEGRGTRVIVTLPSVSEGRDQAH